MADNYLITGYWGEPHVTAENDRGINAAMFGTGRFVLPVGEQFKAEYIGNNTIRMYDGKLMDNGAAAGIPVGEYVDLLISNAGQGMKRNDLIVFQYEQDASTLIESGRFVVIQGAESSGTASDPALTQADLLSGEAVFEQMALWRVSVSGATISAPVKMFSVATPNGIESTEHPGCYYRMVDGVQEWINPPMAIETEYKTTKRFSGKPVYTKAFNTGILPYNSSATIAHGIKNVDKTVSACGYITGQGASVTIPYYDSTTNWIGITFQRNNYTIATGHDATAFTAVLFVEYTKTTD